MQVTVFCNFQGLGCAQKAREWLAIPNACYSKIDLTRVFDLGMPGSCRLSNTKAVDRAFAKNNSKKCPGRSGKE